MQLRKSVRNFIDMCQVNAQSSYFDFKTPATFYLKHTHYMHKHAYNEYV